MYYIEYMNRQRWGKVAKVIFIGNNEALNRTSIDKSRYGANQQQQQKEFFFLGHFALFPLVEPSFSESVASLLTRGELSKAEALALLDALADGSCAPFLGVFGFGFVGFGDGGSFEFLCSDEWLVECSALSSSQ